MNELVNRTSATNKDEFWVFGNSVSRIDGIEMRKMIQMIDETIRMTKMGTVTGNNPSEGHSTFNEHRMNPKKESQKENERSRT